MCSALVCNVWFMASKPWRTLIFNQRASRDIVSESREMRKQLSLLRKQYAFLLIEYEVLRKQDVFLLKPWSCKD
jgi:predicted membrane chloride channel (bestrophin family)